MFGSKDIRGGQPIQIFTTKRRGTGVPFGYALKEKEGWNANRGLSIL